MSGPVYDGQNFDLNEILKLRDLIQGLHPDKQREILTRYLYSRPSGVTQDINGMRGIFSDSFPSPTTGIESKYRQIDQGMQEVKKRPAPSPLTKIF